VAAVLLTACGGDSLIPKLNSGASPQLVYLNY
jgi:hypothetical protein